MDKATAKQVSALLEQAIGKFSEAMDIAQRSLPPAEYETLRRSAGLAIGASPTSCLIPSMSSSRILHLPACGETSTDAASNGPSERPGMKTPRLSERACASRSTPFR